jgi:hypothetical protein
MGNASHERQEPRRAALQALSGGSEPVEAPAFSAVLNRLVLSEAPKKDGGKCENEALVNSDDS